MLVEMRSSIGGTKPGLLFAKYAGGDVVGLQTWHRCIIGECNCRVLEDALQRWAEGCAGLQVALPYYWGMRLQSPRRLIMVG